MNRAVPVLGVILSSPFLLFLPQHSQRSTGPLTWTSYVAELGAYSTTGAFGSNVVDSIGRTKTDGVISRFVPDRSIIVNRMHAEVTYQYQLTPAGGVIEPCDQNPALQLTDGTTDFTLPLNAHESMSTVGGSNDSGPLNVRFPAGAEIKLIAIQGNGFVPDVHSACQAAEINVVVQYDASAGAADRED